MTEKKDNASFKLHITVDRGATPSFNAIKNLRGWWSEEIQGFTDQVGETFFYHYKDVHLCKAKLIEMIPDKKLVYLIVDNQFNFTHDKTEWVDTKLVFELEPNGGSTQITFTHEGLVPSYECYLVCQDAWTSYLQGSLKDLIETGTGRPNGKEGGLNAELVAKWGLPDK